MQLSDRELKALLPSMNITSPDYASPFDPESQLQPASIDLRVDRVVWRTQRLRRAIDLTNRLSAAFSSRHAYKSDLGTRGKFRLKPGALVMTRTLEEFTIPEGYSAEIFTRSSFGRLGLSVTISGYVNPGYRGHMPLQIKNLGTETIIFQPFTALCQIVLRTISSGPERPYGSADLRSKYANDDGGPSRWWMDDIIEKSQQSLGAAHMPEDFQQALLSIMLTRDLSTQLRFERFIQGAKVTEIETVDSALDAFALSETRSLRRYRAQSYIGAVVGLLIAASIAALFSTPFNETRYGPLHIALWVITVLAAVAYAPTFYKKLTAKETDFLLPSDIDNLRLRGRVGTRFDAATSKHDGQ